MGEIGRVLTGGLRARNVVTVHADSVHKRFTAVLLIGIGGAARPEAVDDIEGSAADQYLTAHRDVNRIGRYGDPASVVVEVLSSGEQATPRMPPRS
jgi:hypothetical protein